MGNEFEVYRWVKNEIGYQYELVYEGFDLNEALGVMQELKAQGEGCVKLEWR